MVMLCAGDGDQIRRDGKGYRTGREFIGTWTDLFANFEFGSKRTVYAVGGWRVEKGPFPMEGFTREGPGSEAVFGG